MSDVLLLVTTLPDETSAAVLASHLVEHRLAACVNRLAPCHSVYRWQGQVEHADEIPLLIKTTRDNYAVLEAAVRALHPYAVPELIAVPIETEFSFPNYLDWVRKMCAPE